MIAYTITSEGAILARDNGTVKGYHAFTDNLSSILSVVDENGTKVFDASYDAWGKQTITLNTIGLHRVYTGHEMLSEFDIINMNGRLYDPVLGRFFSPDIYVQMQATELAKPLRMLQAPSAMSCYVQGHMDWQAE